MSPAAVSTVDTARRWNPLLLGLPGHALEQAFEWAEALRASGAEPRRYAVAAAGRPVAALSLLAWRLPGTGAAVLYAPRGPVMEPGAAGAGPGLLEAARDAAAATGAVFLRVSPGAPADRADLHRTLLGLGFRHLPESWTVWNAPRIVMTQPLAGGEDEGWARISASRRREIRASEKAGLVVEPASGPEALASLYRLLVATGRGKGYPVRHRGFFELLWRQYQGSTQAVLLLARSGLDVRGALLGARFGPRAYYLYSALDRAALDRQPRGDGGRGYPGALLFWSFLGWARAAGCRSVQWGGSGTRLPPHPTDPGWGVYQFKRSFGADCEGYLGYYDLVFRPALYAVFRRLERHLGPLAWRLRARLNGARRR